MKRNFFCLIGCLLLAQGQLSAQITGAYEIRLTNADNDGIAVQMRCINPANPCPATSDAMLDITFGIKWLNSYGMNLGDPASNYGVIRSGGETVQGSYEFQIYQLNTAPLFFPEDWANNNWLTIATVVASPIGPGPYLFEINDPGFNPSSAPNFNVNGDDYLPAVNGAVELGALLPVELLTFDAYPQQADVAIVWTTASEAGSSYFDVERSLDGIRFQHLEQVEAAGFSTEKLAYGALDENPSPGTNYYRLKQVDLDGSFEYSHIVSVEFKAAQGFRVFPNPFSSDLQIDIYSEQNELPARLYDIQGRLVWQGMLYGGRHRLTLPDLQTGIFRLEVDLGNRTESVRIVKQ